MRVVDAEFKVFVTFLQEIVGFVHQMLPEEDNAFVFVRTGSSEKKTKSGVLFGLAFNAADTPYRRKVLIPGIGNILTKYPKLARIVVPPHGRGLHILISLERLSSSSDAVALWASAEGRDRWSTLNDWERQSPTYRLGLEWACSDMFPRALRARIEAGVTLTDMGVDSSHAKEAVAV